MSGALPSSFVGDIGGVIRGFGETVTYIPVSGAPEATMKASVQTPTDIALVQDAAQEAFNVFVSIQDLPTVPEQFDRFLIRGRQRTVEEAHAVRASDTIIAWQIRVLG